MCISRLNYFVKNLFRAQARVGKDRQGMAHKAKGLKASTSVQNSATFPTLLLKSSKKVVFLSEISSK